MACINLSRMNSKHLASSLQTLTSWSPHYIAKHTIVQSKRYMKTIETLNFGAIFNYCLQ